MKSHGFCLISSIPLIFSEEWARVDALIEQAENPSSLERFTTEDLVRVKKHIEIAHSYVFPREISAKKPFTKEARKVMTEYVKQSAYKSLLGQNDEESEGNVSKFANGDDKIYNFARSDVFKNASTQKPARLNKAFTSYMKSIGQIVCGSVRATCFLVTSDLVITNYHVYRMIAHEREQLENPNLPIQVLFDYLYYDKTKIVTVEVDKEQNANLENPYLDYKFFRLKRNEGLKGREPLGPKVRNWQLSDGRVVILGHSEGKEMQEEVCVVVGYRAMQERIRERHEQCTGVHMTNSKLLHKTEDCQGTLSYDTTFFGGSSGSPVFEMNGYIVAMHTQAYTLERTQDNVANQAQENVANQAQENVPNPEQGNVPNPGNEDVPNQYEYVPNPAQEDVPNQEQENAPDQEQQNYVNEEQDNFPNQEQENISGQSNTRKYSLMEFGVQFTVICRDVRRLCGDDVVRNIFPYYKLKPDAKSKDST